MSSIPSYPTCPRGLRVQSLVFPKGLFTPMSASEWLARYGYQEVLEETKNFWRARQASPASFTKTGFRTIRLGAGRSRVLAIVGCPKQGPTKRARKKTSRRPVRKKTRRRARS